MKEGWKIKKLEEVGRIFSGNSINSKLKEEKYLNVEDGLNYVATKDIGYNSKINYLNGVKIPFSEIDKFKVAEKNSILICAEGGSAGRKVGILNQDVCFVNKLFALSTNSTVLAKYVFFFYKSTKFKIQFNNSLTGLIGGVSKNKFRELEIPIPPLSEQKQIVESLDKAFEKIDKAIANIERNIENAEELLQSQIESRFNSDLSWERFNLGDLSKIMYGHTSKVDPNGNCKYLRITDIQDSKVNWDQVPSIKIDEKDFLKYNLTKGDIVFARTGATTGKSYLIKDNPNAVFASYLIRVQINNNNILPEFVYKFFSSREYWRVVKSGISGSAQGGFNASKLSELEIKFPKDIIVQNKVVQEIDIIEKITNTLLSKYHKKLLSLSNVKKSILEKAFKGELTSAT